MSVKVSFIGSRGYPFVYSGYETFISKLLAVIDLEKYEITVYCHRDLFKSREKKYNGVHRVFVPSIRNKSLNQLSNSFLSLLHALFILRPEILFFVNTSSGLFSPITKLLGIRTVMITDGLEWKRPKWQGFGSKIFYIASKMASKYIDVLVSDSVEMKNVYLDEFGRDSEFISYGAEAKSVDDLSMLDRHGLEKDSYYLIVGRLIPDNNSHLFLEAFKASYSDKRLVVVGDAPFNDAYAESMKSKADHRVLFTGYVTDPVELEQLYAGAYAYLHGHEYGGTNPTLLKALGYGCAIVSLDNAFSREVLESGKYGQLVAKDLNAVIRLFNIGLAEPARLQLKNKARNRIMDAYQWDDVARAYEHLFDKMMRSSFKSQFVQDISKDDKTTN